MAITIKDISKLTGIDGGSVSRTLRNHPRAMALRPETRKRILNAARKLGYRRNELAATMRTGSNRTVAVILRFDELMWQSVFFDSMVIAGLLRGATRLDYGVKIYADTNLQSGFDAILSHQINHVLSMSVGKPQRAQTAAFCRRHKLKLVFIYEKAHNEFPSVTTADRDSMRAAVLYLAKLGHRRIALICGHHKFHYAQDRHAGYLRGLATTGIKPDSRLIACGNDQDVFRGLNAMLAMPAQFRPTAFVCIADSLAMLVQNAAIKKQIKVPEDVSVIGFGNSDLGGRAISPLCSIAQPFGKMGEIALRLLLDQPCKFSPSADGTYLLPNELIIRESVMPARQSVPPGQSSSACSVGTKLSDVKTDKHRTFEFVSK